MKSLSYQFLYIIVCILFASSGLFGQTQNSRSNSFIYRIKDESDGFKINESTGAFFDKNNRLWISGVYYDNTQFQLRTVQAML